MNKIKKVVKAVKEHMMEPSYRPGKGNKMTVRRPEATLYKPKNRGYK